MSRFFASLFTVAAFAAVSVIPAAAQIAVSSCQVSPPQHFPAYTDSTPGWSSKQAASQVKDLIAVGDVDGDGYDELVAILPGQNTVEVWRWAQTTWTHAAKFPALKQFGAIPYTATHVRLADINGDGRMEVVIYMAQMLDDDDVEVTYSYNPLTAQWTILDETGQIPRNGSDRPSYFFKASATSPQYLRWDSYGIEQFQNGKWVSVPSGVGIDSNPSWQSSTVKAEAVADIDGNGTPDLVTMQIGLTQEFTVIQATLTPPGGPFFSSPLLATTKLNVLLDANAYASFQLADVDGDGTAEVVFNTLQDPTNPASEPYLAVYYWNPPPPANGPNAPGGTFVPVPSPYNSAISPNIPASVSVPGFPAEGYPNTAGVTVLPRALNNTNGYTRGVVQLQSSQTVLFAFQTSGGHPQWEAYYDLSKAGGNPGIPGVSGAFTAPGYQGSVRFAVESSGLVMTVRGANGFVDAVERRDGTVSPLVDPSVYMQNGYPAYLTAAQQAAYGAISVAATGTNGDIRSLYGVPSAPWAAILSRVSGLAAPAAPTGISASDWSAAFQAVQSQTVAEITANQTVNDLYATTGVLLTNTYLVKDASLEEITDVLNLPGQPDVTAEVLGYVNTALSSLGSLVYGVNGFLTLAKTTEEAATIADRVGAAGSFISLLSTITGDTATYTADTPPDVMSGNYNLKLAIDNNDLGAATANTCRQLQSLSSWNEAKPLADGVVSGSIPVDLGTTQSVLQASQAVFQQTAWQALAPSVWNVAAVTPFLIGQPHFNGNPSYPASYVVDASCGYPLVLINVATNNFPSLTALNALFQAPPAGLGANPSAVLLQTNGWSFSAYPGSINFTPNTGQVLTPCAQVPSNGASEPDSAGASLSMAQRPLRNAVAGDAAAQLGRLIGAIGENLADTPFRSRMAMFLQVAASRLKQAAMLGQQPTEAIRLVNDVATRLEWNGRQGGQDGKASMKYAGEAIAIRNLLAGNGTGGSL